MATASRRKRMSTGSRSPRALLSPLSPHHYSHWGKTNKPQKTNRRQTNSADQRINSALERERHQSNSHTSFCFGEENESSDSFDLDIIRKTASACRRKRINGNRRFSLAGIYEPLSPTISVTGNAMIQTSNCQPREGIQPLPLIAPLSQVTASLLIQRRLRRWKTTSPQPRFDPRAIFKIGEAREVVSESGPVTKGNDSVFSHSPFESSRETKPDGLSIVERLYLRAVCNFHSRDKSKARHAQLMLRRLTQAGFRVRPKAMSAPSENVLVPTIKVTVHSEEVSASASERSNADISNKHRLPGRFCCVPKRLSLSDPNLSSTFGLPTSFLLETTGMMPKRKDSVSRIRKRSSIPANGLRRRRSSASTSSHQPSWPEYRRNSLCGTVWPCKRSPASVSPELPQSPDDIDLTTWSHLLSCIPEDERKTSLISRHHVFISIPVCKIGKEKPLLLTSFDVIEHTLRKFYPELIVKKRPSSNSDPVVDEIKEEDDTEQGLEYENASGPQKLNVDPSFNTRRVSINTCISNMRTDTQDYDQQLVGVKNVGTFADEETLKVLFAKSDAISCVIEAMKTFPEKEELQINACNSLLKMASASEANCVHILANDGLNTISSALRIHQENRDIVRLLVGTVAFISTGLEPATSLANGGLHHQVLSVMSRHCSDKLIVRDCCFIIGNLLGSVETAQQLMYVGSVHTIVNLAKQFPKDASILENVCRTLGSFAIYDETCLDVARAGATSTVLGAMQSPAANASIVECGCWALACLTACDQTCDELVTLGGVETILKLMKEYPQEQSLQDYAIRILCNLSDYDQTLSAVSTEEVITLLQRILNQFHGCVELLEIITATLCHILGGEEKLSVFAVEQKCIKDIVTIMIENSDNDTIQENGCKILGNVAVQDYPRKMAEMEGASKAVISAMLNNETNAAVQEVGCLALMNLTAENKDNKVRIKNAGAVPTLLGTLREYSYDTNIVLCALKALGNLISLEEVCHLLLDEKGLETIISLTKSYTTEEKILVFITMILCGIAELPDLKEEEVRLIDKTLVDILSACQNNADVTLYVCQATESLMQTDVGRETLADSNRLGVIQSAINSFPDNPEIHGACCKVIAVVAFYMDSRKRLTTETTVKSVLKSMELFPLEVEIQIVCCGAIACILEKIAILKHEVIGQGGIGIIQKAVNNHQTESRLGVVALMALGFILPIDMNTYSEESRTAYNTVIQCMNNFGENKEIQIAGCNALSLLRFSDKKDVMSMTTVIMNSIRRHGEEPEVQKNAALALKPSYQRGDFINIIGQVLKSPTLKINEYFWKELEQNAGPK